MFNENTVVTIAENQVHSNLDGESVILDLEEGIYYGLDEVGTRIWELIQKPVQIQHVIDAITQEYDVTRERCTADIFNLLADLQEHHLLRVENSKDER